MGINKSANYKVHFYLTKCNKPSRTGYFLIPVPTQENWLGGKQKSSGHGERSSKLSICSIWRENKREDLWKVYILLAKNLPSFSSCSFHPFMLPFWQDTHKNSLLSLDNFSNYFFNSTTVLGDNLIGNPLVWPQSLTFRLYMLICMCYIHICIGMYVICIGITYTSEQL